MGQIRNVSSRTALHWHQGFCMHTQQQMVLRVATGKVHPLMAHTHQKFFSSHAWS